MAFTVDDFEDLVRLLEERPDWQARLRDLLLPREILNLPASIVNLAALNRAALVRLDRLEGVVRGLEGVVRELADVQRASLERLDRLEGAVERLSTNVDKNAAETAAALRRLENDIGDLRGSTWELRFRGDPDFWFSTLLAEPVALSRQQVKAMLEQYVADGKLTRAEAGHILRADLVVAGRDDGEPAYLIVEASRTVSSFDVQRAADRALLLRKATPRVRAVAAGKLIHRDAAELAGQRDVVTEVEEVVEYDPMAG